MDYKNNYMSEEIDYLDIYEDKQNESLKQEIDDRKKRKSKMDRSDSRYSEDDFMNLSRTEQKELAEKYWMGKTSDFDDGTFQFSYSHFTKLCQKLGFRKGVVDTMQDDMISNIESAYSKTMLYIDRGKREDVEIKKFTLSKDTVDKMEKLLGDKLSNIEKSKVIDILISQMLDEKLAEKETGLFGVAYRPIEEERLI